MEKVGGERRFQFLIGSLEAKYYGIDEAPDRRFQFLIGSLEASDQPARESDRPCFNSS